MKTQGKTQNNKEMNEMMEPPIPVVLPPPPSSPQKLVRLSIPQLSLRPSASSSVETAKNMPATASVQKCMTNCIICSTKYERDVPFPPEENETINDEEKEWVPRAEVLFYLFLHLGINEQPIAKALNTLRDKEYNTSSISGMEGSLEAMALIKAFYLCPSCFQVGTDLVRMMNEYSAVLVNMRKTVLSLRESVVSTVVHKQAGDEAEKEDDIVSLFRNLVARSDGNEGPGFGLEFEPEPPQPEVFEDETNFAYLESVRELTAGGDYIIRLIAEEATEDEPKSTSSSPSPPFSPISSDLDVGTLPEAAVSNSPKEVAEYDCTIDKTDEPEPAPSPDEANLTEDESHLPESGIPEIALPEVAPPEANQSIKESEISQKRSRDQKRKSPPVSKGRRKKLSKKLSEKLVNIKKRARGRPPKGPSEKKVPKGLSGRNTNTWLTPKHIPNYDRAGFKEMVKMGIQFQWIEICLKRVEDFSAAEMAAANENTSDSDDDSSNSSKISFIISSKDLTEPKSAKKPRNGLSFKASVFGCKNKSEGVDADNKTCHGRSNGSKSSSDKSSDKHDSPDPDQLIDMGNNDKPEPKGAEVKSDSPAIDSDSEDEDIIIAVPLPKKPKRTSPHSSEKISPSKVGSHIRNSHSPESLENKKSETPVRQSRIVKRRKPDGKVVIGDVELLVNDEGIYTCGACGEVSATERELSKHIKETHTGIQPSSSAAINKEINESTPNGQRARRKSALRKDGKTFYRDHQIEQTEDGWFKCVTCQSSYSALLGTKYHIREQHGHNLQPVPSVKKQFPLNVKDFLKEDITFSPTHRRKTKTPTQFKIPNGNASGDPGELVISHSPESVHSKKIERPSKKTSLKRKFEEEKPILSGFAEKSIVSKPFACPDCKESFSTLNLARRHVKTHHTEKRKSFECSVCDMRFETKEEMRVHKIKSHSSHSHNGEANNTSFESLEPELPQLLPEDNVPISQNEESSDALPILSGPFYFNVKFTHE